MEDGTKIVQIQLPDPADTDPGPGCGYISVPGFEDVCPIGLFVKV